MPNGDAFTDNGNGTATIGGTIGPGTGGFYPLTLTATNPAGSVSEQFSLFVFEPASFFSPATTIFTAGAQNSFNVVTSGFPLSPQQSVPGGISNSTGMALSTGVLPSWLHFIPASVTGANSGNAVLSGAPPSGSQGTYNFTIDAYNQVGQGASQNFTLEVLGPGAMRSPAELTGSGESGAGHLGTSVALSSDGNVALIGAPTDAGAFGAAFLYGRSAPGSGGTWSQSVLFDYQLLTNDSATQSQMLGSSVAISGDGHSLLFGAPQYRGGQGGAWAFGGSIGGIWTQRQGIITDGSLAGGQQGAAVALSNDGTLALVGAPQSNGGYGGVDIYQLSGGTYSLFQTISQTDVAGAHFGSSVAMTPDGSSIIVGGPDGGAGKVWTFVRPSPGGSWFQQGLAIGGGGEVGNGRFGASLAASGDGITLIVGGPADNSNSGAVWAFTRPVNQWIAQGNKLTVSDASGNAQVGSSVALSADGNTALIGGSADDTQSGASVGATWAFRRSGSVWSQQLGKIVQTNAAGSAQQGTAVAISADGLTGLTGGPANNSGAGAVWVLGSSQINTTLSHLPSLTAGQTGAYTITLTNAGSLNTSGGVFWTATVPATLNVTGLSGPAGWTCSTASLGCSTATPMIPTASAQFTLTVRGATVGPVSTTVTATTQQLNSTNSSASDSSTVTKATPVITWPQPAQITHGGALGAGQLDATANVPGAFVYTPPAGTVLPVGNGQTLSVAFTPTDTTDYNGATASTTINVVAPAGGGTGTPPNLILTNTLARGAGNVLVLTVTLANSGGTAAQNMTLTGAKIGTTAGTPLPQTIGTIAAGASVQTTVTFPASVGVRRGRSPLAYRDLYGRHDQQCCAHRPALIFRRKETEEMRNCFRLSLVALVAAGELRARAT